MGLKSAKADLRLRDAKIHIGISNDISRKVVVEGNGDIKINTPQGSWKVFLADDDFKMYSDMKIILEEEGVGVNCETSFKSLNSRSLKRYKHLIVNNLIIKTVAYFFRKLYLCI
jgi:hypothetical protein